MKSLFFSNDGENNSTNKDVLNAYNERNNVSENSLASNDTDESLDNLENSQHEEANEQNIWTSESIQQLIQEVYTDHENAIKCASKIAEDTSKSNSDRLITELLLELERNLSIVADHDVTRLLDEIALEASFKKREELQNVLLERLDAPHNAICNVKLFSELYNIELLDHDQMIEIMNNFLDSESINNVIIECFCEFLSRVGSKMNDEYHFQFVDYFAKLERISTNSEIRIDNRVRCIVENCINDKFYQNN